MLLAGEDLNVRIGEKDTYYGFEETSKRASRDLKTNNRAEIVLEMLNNKDWMVMNGRPPGDERDEFTFTGARGSSVIDYVIYNRKVWDATQKFEVEERVDSDHILLVFKI